MCSRFISNRNWKTFFTEKTLYANSTTDFQSDLTSARERRALFVEKQQTKTMLLVAIYLFYNQWCHKLQLHIVVLLKLVYSNLADICCTGSTKESTSAAIFNLANPSDFLPFWVHIAYSRFLFFPWTQAFVSFDFSFEIATTVRIQTWAPLTRHFYRMSLSFFFRSETSPQDLLDAFGFAYHDTLLASMIGHPFSSLNQRVSQTFSLLNRRRQKLGRVSIFSC